MLMNIEEIFELLFDKNSKVAYKALQELQKESEKTDHVYPYMDRLGDMLDSDNSYIRTRGLTLIAYNAKWDKDYKIDEVIDRYLKHITDVKPITARQCIKLLPVIAENKPELKNDILSALQKADISFYDGSIQPLVYKDIQKALKEIQLENGATSKIPKEFEVSSCGDVYQDCPVFDDRNYCFRLVKEDDAEDLLKVYSDEKAVPYFNSDNCGGDDFHYTSLGKMREAVSYWLWEYERRGFVRWSIFSHKEEEVIGTIELFHRDSEDYFTDCGLLRLDLRSDYEKADVIKEILQQIGTWAFDMFSCRMLETKAVPAAKERIRALMELGYEKSDHALTGHDGRQYKFYWVLNKK